MENANDFRICLITTDSYDNAVQIARILVAEKSAACCNIIQGINSIYEWEGTIKHDREYLIIAKTRSDKMEQLEDRVKELHPYDIPEIISYALSEGSKEYLDWVNNAFDEKND